MQMDDFSFAEARAALVEKAPGDCGTPTWMIDRVHHQHAEMVGDKQCPVCLLDLGSAQECLGHVMERHIGSDCECSVCRLTLRDRGSARNHFLAKHLGGLYACTQCEKTFPVASKALAQRCNHTDGELAELVSRRNMCSWDGCQNYFKPEEMHAHVEQHVVDSGGSACLWRQCRKVLKGAPQCVNHVLDAHLHLEWRCTQCSKLYLRDQRTPAIQCCSRSPVTMGMNANMICRWNGCGQHYSDPNKFRLHFRKTHAGATTGCLWESCGHQASSLRSCWRHVFQAHAGLHWRCDVCGKQFSHERKRVARACDHKDVSRGRPGPKSQRPRKRKVRQNKTAKPAKKLLPKRNKTKK